MKNVKIEVKNILTQYLEQNNMRKTVERFAVLDAAYSFGSFFTIEELDDLLMRKSFPVSRATLYNSLKLFQTLQLVVCHRLYDGTKYEATFIHHSNCHQICTMCGKVTEVKSQGVIDAINKMPTRRFHKDGFTVYVYGICSSCQTKLRRSTNKGNETKKVQKSK